MSEASGVKKFIQFLVDKPYLSILIGIIILVGVSFGVKNMTPDFSYRIWFQEGNPHLKEFDAFERKFGSDELAVVIVHSPSGIFDMETAKLMVSLTEDMWQAPEVIRVDSLTNFNWVHGKNDDIMVEPLIPDDIPLTEDILKEREQIAINHKTIKGYLVNEKGDTALIFARLKPALEGTPNYENVVQSMREIIAKYNNTGDHKIYLTGTPVLNFAFKEASQSDMAKLVPFVLLITILFLMFSLRRASGVLLPLLVIVTTVAMTMGFGGWSGIHFNNLTGIVPQFMIAISIAVVVHMMVTFFQYYNGGMGKREAVIESATKNMRPTLLTSISTAIGFFSFSTSAIPPIMNMGQMAGAGTMFSWLLTYLFVIPLLILLPIKAKIKNGNKMDEKMEPSQRGLNITNLLFKYRFAIIGFSFAVAAISFIATLTLEVNSDPFKYFDEKYPMTIATDFVEKNLGGATGAEIVVDSGSPEGIKDPSFLKKVGEYQAWLEGFPYVTKTVSIVDILKDMNKTLQGGQEDQYKIADDKSLVAQQLMLYTMNLPQGMDINDRVSLENDAIRLTAMWTLHSSKESLAAIENYEKKAKELGLNASVTGKFPLYQTNNGLVVDSFITSMSLAVVLVSILLMIGLQSVKLGLISIVPNALPLIIGGGFLKLFNQPLDIGTVIVGSVCIGIAVDDTIHFLANFKKHIASGSSAQEAVAKIMTYTAPALITTTVVLVSAFATFAFGSFVPNKNFGIFVALILSVALVMDLVFLPSLLMSIGVKQKQGA